MAPPALRRLGRRVARKLRLASFTRAFTWSGAVPPETDRRLSALSTVNVTNTSLLTSGASLWIYESDLAEIRSLGVDEGFQGRGLGKQLVQYFIEKARSIGIERLFVLTRMPAFFEKCGFRTVSINSLPQKVTKDCAQCPKNQNCDEIAMVIDLKESEAS